MWTEDYILSMLADLEDEIEDAIAWNEEDAAIDRLEDEIELWEYRLKQLRKF